jgi:hypothetical protein
VIVLGHFDSTNGSLLGVWLGPAPGESETRSFYPGVRVEMNVVKETINAKGSDPTWDDWLDQLGDGLPYGERLGSFDLTSDISIEGAFWEIALIAQRHGITEPDKFDQL